MFRLILTLALSLTLIACKSPTVGGLTKTGSQTVIDPNPNENEDPKTSTSDILPSGSINDGSQREPTIGDLIGIGANVTSGTGSF